MSEPRSKEGWTKKAIENRIAFLETNLAHHEEQAQRTREQIEALRQDMGTIPVKETK